MFLLPTTWNLFCRLHLLLVLTFEICFLEQVEPADLDFHNVYVQSIKNRKKDKVVYDEQTHLWKCVALLFVWFPG
ncbi:hypothetical protein MKW92_044782 [Papaver armeniacum]|nr:hypothetical protein MKW92_044782 [Papaver armeniacum]